ncbi:DUF4398 domain-containing protein [Dyella subtropica]|uniref:DUF4398 domain-containing protein n=1 Tax=Dyella subtropica TaxID=2992127 RepID=UPI0022509B54|nr:DUF4398 domain-containing protein [Dyella subtropica]
MVHIFFPLNGRSKGVRTAVSTLVLALALASLGGCASVPPPDGAMSLAQSQLRAARDAGAADYAPVDLDFAQNKFQQAQAAMARSKYEDAAALAEEAQADAELARAKARLGAARAQIQNKAEANSRLRDQIEQSLSSHEAPQSQQSGLPAQQPTNDMPAPSSSMLQPIPQGQGFQTLPQSNDQGGHP